jgi:hypothetical protein
MRNVCTLPVSRCSACWLFAALLCVPVGWGCAFEAVSESSVETNGPVQRVLFIGNSLTAGNDLPQLVQAMAAAGGKRLQVEALTPGGFSLEDHWTKGTARKKLASAKWDIVVLQQGPSSLPESQVNLKEWAKKWADEIRKQGAKPYLYMVWPFQNQDNGFDQVSKSYRAAAEACEATILPAGEAWREALKSDPNAGLYTEDRLHPAPAGSYLAALVIAHGLVDVSPDSVPSTLRLPTGKKFSLPDKQAANLRRIAAKKTES